LNAVAQQTTSAEDVVGTNAAPADPPGQLTVDHAPLSANAATGTLTPDASLSKFP
jgi:hypothetical protein